MIGLLVATFVVSLAVATLVVVLFTRPISGILRQIVGEDIARAWLRYLQFALFVMGIGGGVRVYDLERYISPQGPGQTTLELTSDRWVLEIYQTIIGTLQSTATVLLVFFVFALIAYVIVRALESRRPPA
ncbi:MAG: hypothetical protein M1401_03075 [Chloroflexi bacterium]|nr:hypothetical protein [Chloroflexota bacterium]MCL5107857.1 hypothetical protein [Chloroflexota bacterium]